MQVWTPRTSKQDSPARQGLIKVERFDSFPGGMEEFVMPNGTVLKNVHSESQCSGRGCVIHNPSDHHMKDWYLHWRDDRKIFERICEHLTGHPDPDQFDYWHSIDKYEVEVIHGCCGCCRDA